MLNIGLYFFHYHRPSPQSVPVSLQSVVASTEYVAVYYDAHNLVARSATKDVYAEPKLLGKRISQIHVKNANMLLATPGGRMDWPRMAQQFYDIGYRGWYVLETDSPTKDIIADTRANIDYVKKTFRIPATA